GQEIHMVGVDCAIIMNPKVWEASGHVGGFADQMVDCKKCRKRFRADKVFVAALHPIPVPHHIIQDVIFTPTKILSVEANDISEATTRLEALKDRLAKKRKLDSGLILVKVQDVLHAPRHWTLPCPDCSEEGQLTEPRAFNLMFESHAGAVQD